MKLHCLGTTGYHPSDTRHTSCYFLPGPGIVLDAGTGIYRLPKLIETDHLNILLSHAHLDHIFGLTCILDILFQRPVRDVRVWGEARKIDAIKRHLFSEELFPIMPDVDWRIVKPGKLFEMEGDVEVSSFPLRHPGGSLGYRLNFSDRSMAYVTDTTANEEAAYIDEILGVDLLMHECNFRTSQNEWAVKTGHSSAETVGKVAALSGAKQTWLIHINPLEPGKDPVGIDDARQHESHVEVATDGQVIEF